MEDPAEIAALTSEYVSSLDNVPQEVSHILREIQIKDGKVQGRWRTNPDTLSRIASKQDQMRDLFQGLMDASGSTSTSESNKVKLQRLATRIAADYARAEDWSTQKRILAKDLWRKIYFHCDHLQRDLDRIHPDIVASVMSTVPKAPEIVSRGELPSVLMDVGLGDLEEANESKTKRKRTLQPVQTNVNGRHSPSFSRQDRPSATSSRQTPFHDLDVTTFKDRANGSLGEHEEERDENLYCFCQRGSFGEMIGCDSDDCKFEWFHIGCVGVSKPLPQTWLCSDCLAKNKRRRRQ